MQKKWVLTLNCVLFGAITWTPAGSELITQCIPADVRALQDINMRATVTGVTKQGDKELPVTVYEGPGAVARVIIGSDQNLCARYELRDVTTTDPTVISLINTDQNCTRGGELQVEGLPSCETVQELGKKLSRLKFTHVIEGTDTSKTLGPNQPDEVTRVQLGFCARNATDNKAPFLCMENTTKTYKNYNAASNPKAH